MPYLGYVEVAVTFPKELLCAEYEVPTLALVVPDSGTSGCQILIGTNTLDVMYNMRKEKSSARYQPVPSGYRTDLKVLQQWQEKSHYSNVPVPALVRMQGRDRKVIPAQRTVFLEAVVLVKEFHTEKSAILEYPSSSSLPGRLLVKPCVIDLPCKQPHKLPVVNSNESDHDIILLAKTAIAELSAIQTILSHKQSMAKPSDSEHPKAADLAFDFSESPVPSEWKDRITQKLRNIKLSDETPL